MLGFKAAFWLLAAAMVQLSLCAEDYYNILGVGKSASEKEIKNAYRSLSKKYHPDKNPGDDTAHDKFVEVSEAYEVLSNSEARQVYDRYGVDGLQNFRNRRQNGHDAYPRGNNVEVKLEIALRDFYNGATTEFAWNKQHLCDQCDGTGSADKEVDTCRQCDGHGHITKKMMIMPGVYQQIRSPCNACGGRGKTIRNVCPACQGSRVMNKLTTVTLNIERGKPVDSQVVYENEAHQSPDWIAGDLLVTLAEKQPSLDDNNPDRVDGTFFHRNGDDLFWTEVLSLREAWMGDWTRNITHLDAHTVRLGRRRGEVVQPGHIETIVGQGMPKWHEDGESVYHKHEFGNLYVEYVVVLPDRMDGGMLDEFWSLWQKWRGKHGVDLQKDSGRPEPNDGHVRDEL